MARWLSLVGIAMVLASIVLQQLPATEPVGGALWALGFPLALAWYPGRSLRPRWLLIVVLLAAGYATAYLVTGGDIAASPLWMTVIVPHLLVVVMVAVRYRRRLDTDDRERVRWGLLGGVICLGGMALLLLIVAVAGFDTIAAAGPAAEITASVLTAVFPLTLLVGIVRPRLLAVDPLLRAVILVISAALILGAEYWAVTMLATAWIGALVVGASAYPVSRLAVLVAERLVYGDRPDPARAVLELGRRLDQQSDPSQTAATLADTARDLLHLSVAHVVPPGETGFTIAYRGEPLGTLSVQPRHGETALTRRDRAVLAALTYAAAPALHGAIAFTELIDARARVMLAHEEERKRLRQDLHDDLAPTLAGLGYTAAGIARLVKSADPDAEAAAASLAVDAQAAIAQTREITYGLRPPILDDHGLTAAIRDRVLRTDGLAVQIDAPTTRLALPAAVELATLRIVQEAVLNVRKHAHASRCDIRLAVSDDVFEVRISDDGTGIDQTVRPGIGLASIRERARELGGLARIRRGASGGTVVDVLFPLVGTP